MEVSALCPAIKVRIQIGSKMLDDFKMFSRFVLRALFDGYTIADIDAVIGLGETVVIEEIEYLKKIGFIAGEGNAFSVSGKSFYALMSAVDTFNECKIDVFVELYSGKILPYKSELFVSNAEADYAKTLTKNIYLSALYERNYGETIEFIHERHCNLLEGINETQKESIYTQLEFTKESEGFIRLTLDEVPPLDNKSEQAPTNAIRLRRSLLHINWTVKNLELEGYRDYLELLKTLSNVGAGILISAYGHNILGKAAKERECNNEIKPLIYDNFLRQFIDRVPSGIDIEYDIEYDIELPQQIVVLSKQWQNSCKDYFAYYIEQNILHYTDEKNHLVVNAIAIDNSYYTQHVPFDLFLSNLLVQDEREGQ